MGLKWEILDVRWRKSSKGAGAEEPGTPEEEASKEVGLELKAQKLLLTAPKSGSLSPITQRAGHYHLVPQMGVRNDPRSICRICPSNVLLKVKTQVKRIVFTD